MPTPVSECLPTQNRRMPVSSNPTHKRRTSQETREAVLAAARRQLLQLYRQCVRVVLMVKKKHFQQLRHVLNLGPLFQQMPGNVPSHHQ